MLDGTEPLTAETETDAAVPATLAGTAPAVAETATDAEVPEIVTGVAVTGLNVATTPALISDALSVAAKLGVPVAVAIWKKPVLVLFEVKTDLSPVVQPDVTAERVWPLLAHARTPYQSSDA